MNTEPSEIGFIRVANTRTLDAVVELNIVADRLDSRYYELFGGGQAGGESPVPTQPSVPNGLREVTLDAQNALETAVKRVIAATSRLVGEPL